MEHQPMVPMNSPTDSTTDVRRTRSNSFIDKKHLERRLSEHSLSLNKRFKLIVIYTDRQIHISEGTYTEAQALMKGKAYMKEFDEVLSYDICPEDEIQTKLINLAVDFTLIERSDIKKQNKYY